jgi:hypothetical protein
MTPNKAMEGTVAAALRLRGPAPDGRRVEGGRKPLFPPLWLGCQWCAGYHSEDNLKGLAERQVNAYICDSSYRQRDERFADQAKP